MVSRPEDKRPPGGAAVCDLGAIGVGGAIVVACGRGASAMEIIVVRDDAGVRGFVNVCPHNPLPLNIDSRIYAHDNHVHCDHHFAVFRFSDGTCTAGACLGDALTPVALDVRDGWVVVAQEP